MNEFEKEVTTRIKLLVENDNHAVEAIRQLVESITKVNLEIELLNRRIDRLEQKSSISYLRSIRDDSELS